MKLRALIVLDTGAQSRLFSHPDDLAEIASLVDLVGPTMTRKQMLEKQSILQDVDILLTGWGAPTLDASLLSAAPNLKAVFYAAGSIKSVMTEAAWNRGIVITSAYSANAIPVAEFCLATIIFSLKHVWQSALQAKLQHRFASPGPMSGAYGATIGLISMGQVARRLREMLRILHVEVIAYDPFMSLDEAQELGVERVELADVFSRSHVVSLHTPNLPQTRGMITGQHINSMKPNATFINTARGAVVRENELIESLRHRPDLTAVLDVTDPEPPLPGSLLWTLPNVMLTPHIAGSIGQECRRMVRSALDDLRRYLAGEKLQTQITREQAARLA